MVYKGRLLEVLSCLVSGFSRAPKKKKEKQPAIRKEGVVLRPSFLMDLFLYVFFFSEDGETVHKAAVRKGQGS